MNEKNVQMVCRECGSPDVLVDAYGEWDIDKQDWIIANTFDKGAFCHECDGETRIEAVPLNGADGTLERCAECDDECTDDDLIGVHGRLLCEPCADRDGAQ